MKNSQELFFSGLRNPGEPSKYIFYNFIDFIDFLAVLSLCCCVGLSLVVASVGYSLVMMGGLLIVVVSLVAEHKFNNCGSRA